MSQRWGGGEGHQWKGEERFWGKACAKTVGEEEGRGSVVEGVGTRLCCFRSTGRRGGIIVTGCPSPVCLVSHSGDPHTQASCSEPAELSTDFSRTLQFCVHVQVWGAGRASEKSQQESLCAVQVFPDLNTTSVH